MPLQARYNQLINEEGYLDTILAQGAEKATQVAEQTLALVKDKVGLLHRK
jgi:tryptophanyl-tRNA synthetase